MTLLAAPPNRASRWVVCARCGSQVDARWWAYGHAVRCFPEEFDKDKEASFVKFFAEDVTHAR